MRYLAMGGLILAGVIHLIPVTGVLGADRLRALYGIPVEGPDVAILLRHRAVLFALLGLLMIAGAFLPSLRWPALIGALVSTLAFLAIALPTPDYNSAIGRVVRADIVALAALLVAAAATWLGRAD